MSRAGYIIKFFDCLHAVDINRLIFTSANKAFVL